MTLMEISNNFGVVVLEQIKYIYDAFCKEYESVRYDERKEIVGIGEPDKYLFCYFKREGDNIFVKFKSEEQSFELPTSLERLDYYINQTVLLFNNNDFTTKRKIESTRKTSSKRRENIAYRSELVLSICLDGDRLVEQYSSTEKFFEQKLIEFKKLLGVFVEQVIYLDRDKAIITSLLEQKRKLSTLKEIGERYGITSVGVGQVFRKSLKRIKRRINLKYEDGVERYDLRNKFLEDFSTYDIDAFMLYILANKYDFALKAFLEVMMPPNYYTEDLIDILRSSCKRLKVKAKERTKTIKYNDFRVLVDGDGNVITELGLLEQLNKARRNLANEKCVLEKWVYKNAQLVTLATLKPTDKESYTAIFGENSSWEEYGQRMTQIIKRYIEDKK